MLSIWMVGVPPSIILNVRLSPSSAIMLLYPTILRSGAQSVISGAGARRDNNSDKYKGV